MRITDIRSEPGSDVRFGRMHSELFGRELDVVLHGGEEYSEYFERCAAYLDSMPEPLLTRLKECSLRYCEDMRQYSDPDAPGVPEGVSARNILDYARANCLIIEKPRNRNVIAFGVEFTCDWEPEHGMEWTVRDGRALYVADFMGISPWYADAVYATECRSYVYDGFTM